MIIRRKFLQWFAIGAAVAPVVAKARLLLSTETTQEPEDYTGQVMTPFGPMREIALIFSAYEFALDHIHARYDISDGVKIAHVSIDLGPKNSDEKIRKRVTEARKKAIALLQPVAFEMGQLETIPVPPGYNLPKRWIPDA